MPSETAIGSPGNEPEVLPEVDPLPTPPSKKRGNSSRRPSGALVEDVLAMFAHSGPIRDPILEKIGSAQIDRTLEIRAKQEDNAHLIRVGLQKSADWLTTQLFLFSSFALLVVVGLCWLFLHYGKTDQVFNLLALVFAGGGGMGIGYGLRPNLRSTSDSSSSESNSNLP